VPSSGVLARRHTRNSGGISAVDADNCVDWPHLIIPNVLSGAGLCLAIVHTTVKEPEAMLDSFTFAVLHGSTFALALLGIGCAYKWTRGREGIGLGDVKLAGVAGMWLDWFVMPIFDRDRSQRRTVLLLLRQLIIGQPIRATSRLPFGMLFAPAIWICWGS
jgi:leader peptidase (prepilin peptidase)/N-methyltransferase